MILLLIRRVIAPAGLMVAFGWAGLIMLDAVARALLLGAPV